MTIFEQRLWFDNCALDHVVTIASAAIVGGVLLLVARRLGLSADWLRGRVRFYTLLLLIVSLWPYPERIIRIAVAGDVLDVRTCRWHVGRVGRYQVSDVDFTLERRENREGVSQTLTARRRSDRAQIGSVVIQPQHHFDLAALRRLGSTSLIGVSDDRQL